MACPARDGAVAGLREGRELGVRTGFGVAEEVAFYDGCTKVQWSSKLLV